MPRASRTGPRRRKMPARTRRGDFSGAKPTDFSPQPDQEDRVFWQCSSCGAPGDPINGRGEDSYCPHCRTGGTVIGECGKIPFPALYHAWSQKQQRTRENERLPATFRPEVTSTIQHGGDTMRRKKTHSGSFHCPACFIEFDLMAEESLKCDRCNGPLAKGSLDEVWVDDEDTEEDE